MEMEKEFEQIDKAGSWAAIYQVGERPRARRPFAGAAWTSPSGPGNRVLARDLTLCLHPSA